MMMAAGLAWPMTAISNVQPVAPGRDAAEVLPGKIHPRSKGKQAKRKKRPNMRLVSKRVRRKHRRVRT